MKRWHKIALLVIVIIGVLVSVKSCVDKKEADLTVAYIGNEFIDRDAFSLGSEALGEVVGDINSDGEFVIDIMEISFNESLTSQDKSNATQKLTNALGMGVARLYFIEEVYVIANADKGVFEDLSHLGDGFRNSDGQVVAIELTDKAVYENLGLPEEERLFVAVRVVSEIDEATDKSIGKKHKAAMDAAEYVLGYNK